MLALVDGGGAWVDGMCWMCAIHWGGGGGDGLRGAGMWGWERWWGRGSMAVWFNQGCHAPPSFCQAPRLITPDKGGGDFLSCGADHYGYCKDLPS